MLIRLVTTESDSPLLMRQFPESKGIWNGHRFSTTTTECDACIVYEGFSKPFEVRCPPDKTLFFAAEPPSIRQYDRGFLAQFHRVVSCQTQIPHPRPSIQQPALPWHLGMRNSPLPHLPDGNDFRALNWHDKPHLLSVICSDKAFTEGHRKRLDFVRALKESLGDQLHFFGRGINEIEDKWEAVVPFRYHIAIENSRVDHYWTEKLADAFLGGSHPFYIGAPNIHDYFDVAALTLLPLDSPQDAAQIITDCIARDVASQSLTARQSARDLVMNEYNWPVVTLQLLSGASQMEARTMRFKPEPPGKISFPRRVKNRLRSLVIPKV